MNHLTAQQNKVHQRAIALSKNREEIDVGLIDVLQEVDRLEVHCAMGVSVFNYAVKILRLDKSVAYPLITLARKSKVVPELKAAIQDRSLTVAKASRIVSSLNAENAVDLIDFAKKHQRDAIDFEIAKRNPKAKSRDRMKPLSEDLVEVKVCMPKATFEKLKRAESLEAQKGKSFKWGDVLDAALEVYLDKNDPVRKAERAARKKGDTRIEKSVILPVKKIAIATENKVSTASEYSVKPKYRRVPLTAEQKHAVHLRDQGRCTHQGSSEKRCNSEKWTDIHHIIPVSQGGTNDIENLTTLCSFHHDLVHQLSLPIEGQVTWLRSPIRPYRVG